MVAWVILIFPSISASRSSCGHSGHYPVAMQPSAKGFFPESHSRFLGTYWGQVSSPYCSEVVESCDAYLFAGAIHNDYSSVGYSLLLKKEKMIDVGPYTLVVTHISDTYTGVWSPPELCRSGIHVGV